MVWWGGGGEGEVLHNRWGRQARPLPRPAVGSSDFDIFLRNSKCFMCSWFGLEILRLVCKKSVFFKY
jgi:hypothetical protein